MNRRSLNVAFSIIGCCVIALVALLAIDGLIAVNRMNPVPAAETAAAQGGFQVDPLQLRSYDVSGGILGSSAVVRYCTGDKESAPDLEVRLRRPLLRANWQVVSVETK